MWAAAVLALTALGTAGNDSLLNRGGGWRTATAVVSPMRTISLSDEWLIPSSVKCIFNADTLTIGHGLEWTDSAFVLTVLDPGIQPGDSLNLCWQSAAVARWTTYRYYLSIEPTQLDEPGSPATVEQPGADEKQRSPLESSGSITRGVTFGESGAGVESGLHLEAHGSLAPNVQVAALIDDRDVPASESGGGSAALAELDRITLRAITPNIRAELGDWDLDWSGTRFGNLTRRLRGGRLAVEALNMNVEAAAAGSDNRYRHIVIIGRAGDLGPYELADNSSGSFITIQAGSERVWLNGRRLTAGRGGDYVIDYSRGRLTFNPNIILRDDSRIEVDYRYNEEAYQGSFFGGRWRFEPGKGTRITAALAAEGSRPDQPLAFILSDSVQVALSQAGDNPQKAVVSGVDSVGPGRGDYVWADTLNLQVLKFAPPDSLGRPAGYLAVDFRRVPGGDYDRQYDPEYSLFRFFWVGKGQGGWSPTRQIPLPERKTLSSVQIDRKMERWAVSAEAAFSDFDRNLSSNLDDDDNRRAAWRFDGSWGGGQDAPLSANFAVRRREADFAPLTNDREPDFSFIWNLPDTGSAAETLIEGGIGVRPTDEIRLAGSAGALELGDGRSSRRWSGEGDIARGGWGGTLLWRRSVSSVAFGVPPPRDLTAELSSLRLERRAGWIKPSYGLIRERRSNAPNRAEWGVDYVQHSASVKGEDAYGRQAQLDFQYRENQRGLRGASVSRIVAAELHGSAGGLRGVRVRFQRYGETFADSDAAPIRMTAASVALRVVPRRGGWRGSAAYETTTGNDRSGVWIAEYAGEGRGGYRWEDGRYIPDPDGGFDLNLIPTDSLSRLTRTALNARFEWNFRAGEGRRQPPLGLTSWYLNLEGELTTGASDLTDGLLLLPQAFVDGGLLRGGRTVHQDLGFLETLPGGDGRLSLRWDERRDRALHGSEATDARSAAFRLRLRPTSPLRLRIEPLVMREYRWRQTDGLAAANVATDGIESEIQYGWSQAVETGLAFNYQHRFNRVNAQTADDRRWKPWVRWSFSRDRGAVRTEAHYSRLSASDRSPGYDLDRGDAVGDNLLIATSADYRLTGTLQLGANLRSRWVGGRSPRHDGIVQVTARF